MGMGMGEMGMDFKDFGENGDIKMHLRSCLIVILCELQSTSPATPTSLGTTRGATGTPTTKMLTHTTYP